MGFGRVNLDPIIRSVIALSVPSSVQRVLSLVRLQAWYRLIADRMTWSKAYFRKCITTRKDPHRQARPSWVAFSSFSCGCWPASLRDQLGVSVASIFEFSLCSSAPSIEILRHKSWIVVQPSQPSYCMDGPIIPSAAWRSWHSCTLVLQSCLCPDCWPFECMVGYSRIQSEECTFVRPAGASRSRYSSDLWTPWTFLEASKVCLTLHYGE